MDTFSFGARPGHGREFFYIYNDNFLGRDNSYHEVAMIIYTTKLNNLSYIY